MAKKPAKVMEQGDLNAIQFRLALINQKREELRLLEAGYVSWTDDLKRKYKVPLKRRMLVEDPESRVITTEPMEGDN